MKNTFKLILLTLLVSLGFISCEKDESYIYHPSNECVTFKESAVSFSFSEEPEPIVINLVRGSSESDLTLNLDFVQDEANVFSISSRSVHFAPGESYAQVQVTYIPFEDIPAGKHNFTVSFDKSMVSPAGSCSIGGAATKRSARPEGGYLPHATVEFWSSRMNSHIAIDAEKHSVLEVSYDNKNDYRIKNIINSGIDLYFNTDPEGDWVITGPAPEECPYDGNEYIKIPSTILYEGEPVTFWIDPTPKYLTIYDKGTDHGDEYTMS
ncbi:MAG: hypothetical protein KBS89_04675, partial [Bacteroidales bacterium]|nr:hypothetical protein [Candidatus Egerieousia equi]